MHVVNRESRGAAYVQLVAHYTGFKFCDSNDANAGHFRPKIAAHGSVQRIDSLFVRGL